MQATSLMIGVFVGNWLIFPSLTAWINGNPVDYTKGFFIGLIAAFLVLVFYFFANLVKSIT